MMNELETHSRPGDGRLREQPIADYPVGARLGKCLIVSAQDNLLQAVSRAAGDAGWDPVVYGDLASARVAVQRVKFQLAWVDLTCWESEGTDGQPYEVSNDFVVDNVSRRISRRVPQGGLHLPNATPLDGPATIAARLLCEAIAGLRHVLLVACGNAGDAAEEIWARQLGVWLYLPDVAWEETGDLAFLCEQARLVAGDGLSAG